MCHRLLYFDDGTDLKDQFTQKWVFSHYLLTLLMESRMKSTSSGALQQNSVSPKQSIWWITLKHWAVKLINLTHTHTHTSPVSNKNKEHRFKKHSFIASMLNPLTFCTDFSIYNFIIIMPLINSTTQSILLVYMFKYCTCKVCIVCACLIDMPSY